LINKLGNSNEYNLPNGSAGLDHTPNEIIQKPSSHKVLREQKTTQPPELKVAPKTVNQNLPAFQIQFGFFGNKTNAHNVLTKLIENGHSDCYIAEEVRDGKTFFRVLSPLFSGQSDAKMVLTQTKVIGLEGAIIKVQ
jgi:cell division septation protein DedD